MTTCSLPEACSSQCVERDPKLFTDLNAIGLLNGFGIIFTKVGTALKQQVCGADFVLPGQHKEKGLNAVHVGFAGGVATCR